MAERIQKTKQTQEREDEQVEDLPTERSAEAEETLDITDELLDEIDGLLEENAEQMVKDYVQKGGE